MQKRASTTAIAVLAGRVVRADFDGAPNAAAARFWQAPRKPGAGLPESVRQALALGGLAGGRCSSRLPCAAGAAVPFLVFALGEANKPAVLPTPRL